MPGGTALTLALDMGSIGTSALVLLFVGASVLLILAILIQKPQGGGLATAFGAGAGSGQTAFGARTGDALTVMTIILFALYLLVGIGLVWVAHPAGPAEASTISAPAGEAPATGETPAPSTGTPAGTGSAAPVTAEPVSTPVTVPPTQAVPVAPAPATGGPGR